VDVQVVRLRAVGLPEERGGGGAELRDAAAGLGGADGPGGEGGYFFEVWGERGWVGLWLGGICVEERC